MIIVKIFKPTIFKMSLKKNKIIIAYRNKNSFRLIFNLQMYIKNRIITFFFVQNVATDTQNIISYSK